LKYKDNPMMFQVAINHLQCNNMVPIIEDSFFPPDVTYANDKEYEAAWQHLVSSLQPRDIVFTFNRKSLISKVIAKFTHGPFSHCAVHAENGIIHEIVTSGTRMVNIDVYKGRDFRVAVFRHYGKAPDMARRGLVARLRPHGPAGVREGSRDYSESAGRAAPGRASPTGSLTALAALPDSARIGGVRSG
jgi:hypothetical protein